MDSPAIPSVGPRRWLSLGSLEKIPLGQGLAFQVGSVEIAVFRQRDGKLFATESRCPHQNGPLADGLVGAGKVICPLHAKKFDLATGQGAERPWCVRTYPVKEIAKEILLCLEDGSGSTECAPAA